jgi:hypothetical protein
MKPASVTSTNNWWGEGSPERRTELSVANLVKTLHSIYQAAPRLVSVQLIASVGATNPAC